MRRRRSTRGSGVLLAVLVLAGGCGVPSEGRTKVIEPSEIPYALASPASSAKSPSLPPSSGPTAEIARVYFVDPELDLIAVPLADASSSRRSSAQAVLQRLTTGPDGDERDAGLQSALGPDVRFTLGSLDEGVVTVEVAALSPDQSADRLPLAVGQIVLSLTSVVGIDGVRLQRDGVDREVPLPGGALTAKVLTAGDYASLVAPA